METVSIKTEQKIAWLTLNSPPANALSSTLLHDIDRALDMIEKNIDNVKVMIVHGEGRFFSAGADIKEFTTLEHAEQFEQLGRLGQKVFNRMENFQVPIIAAIHGAALGGGLELALACHMRFVTEDAKLGLPELSLGIIPGFAGTQRLPELVGSPKAYEMMLTSEPLTGKEAHVYGLANNYVKTDEDVVAKAHDVAKKIATKSKLTITDIMELVGLYKRGDGKIGFEEEAIRFGKVFMNEDAKEGIAAFIEKRKPTFTDE